MTQLVTRIDAELTAALDELVVEGIVDSRSDAVRRGLFILIDQTRRRRIGDAIIAGYQTHPQTETEAGWSDEATKRMIGDEPW